MITQTLIPIDNARLALWQSGEGQPTVLFMAGGLCDHHSWVPQLSALAQRYRCLAPDPRGCGQSPTVGPFDVVQQAQDVATILTQLNVGPAVIVSHSMGGYAALRLTHHHPELVLGHVFIDVPLSEAGMDTSRIVDTLHEAGSLEPLEGMIHSMGALAAPAVQAAIREMMLTRPVEVAAGMLSNLDAVTENMSDLLNKAAAKPCLAIWPGPKPMGGDPTWLARKFPSIQQEMIDGVGHFVQLEAPKAVSHMLTEFIETTAPA